MYAIDIVIPRVSEKESERERGVESRQKRKSKMSCTSSILLWVGQSGGGGGTTVVGLVQTNPSDFGVTLCIEGKGRGDDVVGVDGRGGVRGLKRFPFKGRRDFLAQAPPPHPPLLGCYVRPSACSF